MTTPRLLSERYELGDTLGYGGMSEVHRGLDTRLGRDVAVKVLRADLARDPQFQMRFRREAQNAAALNHPAIVAVYDTGEVQSDFGPLPYIVMEYVDGQTLREIVKTHGADEPAAGHRGDGRRLRRARLLPPHNIIHRDVKPANIMINRAGAVKVMDFGIARALGEGQNVTQTAAVIGTAQYLSPEQARGEAVDARSDVYAAGCVLFELLTGEPPFTGDSPVAVAYQHVREDPRSPSEVNPPGPAGARRDRAQGAVQEPGQPLPVRRRDARRPGPRALRAAAAGADRDERGRAHGAARPAPAPRRRPGGSTAAAPPGTHRRPTPPTAYGDYDDEPDRRRGRADRIGIAACSWCSGCSGSSATRSSAARRRLRQVAVPDVSGQQPEAARAALQAANLLATIDAGDVGGRPDGQGRRHRPAGGTEVAERTTSRCRSATARPGHRAAADRARPCGRPGRCCRARARPRRRRPSRTPPTPARSARSSPRRPPRARTSPAGTAVAVVVGKQQTTVAVPDVTGQDADDAQKELQQAGFTVRTTSVDGGGNAGEVAGTDPPAGTQAAPKSTVTMQVSSGDSNSIDMPNVGAGRIDQAQATLAAAGFTNIRVQPRARTGRARTAG